MLRRMPRGSLNLIVGPPNAGRAGAIRRRFTEALDHDPILVVPTRDDVDRFERELSEDAGLVGGSVGTFPALFEDVARATGAGLPARLTEAQRLWLVREAVAEEGTGALRASAASPGFAPAMERLLGELQSEGLDPDTLERRAADAGGDARYEVELANVFRAYERLRDAAGRCDRHSLAASATAALRAAPDAWGNRPVLLYGFDDLTAEQLELIAALSGATDVAVAVTYEPDRAALAARAELLAKLRDELGGRIADELAPHSAYTASSVLFHLERHLFEPPERIGALDDGLVALSAAGERAEAEQIGGEVARLLASGVAADDVAIVVRSPERHGPLFDEVLAGLGIPVAVDAGVRFGSTATGRSLIALLRAVGDSGSAEDVLAFLRAPGRADPGSVDWLERHLRRNSVRDAGAALEEWERRHWEPDEVTWLRESSPAALAHQVGFIARKLAEGPHRREAPRAGRATTLELRAAAAAEAALREVAELPGPEPTREELVALLEELAVPLWRGPAEGRVRVLSPYRVRARRVRHLFVASLQEGEFPSHKPGDPLLGDDRRADLELPPRRDPELEERYLFYACVSRPSDRLYLSWRDSDDDGQVLPSSPFLEDVADLLPPGSLAPRRRGLDAVVFGVGEAPSPDELARSLAAVGGDSDPHEALASLDVPAAIAEPVAARLRAAASTISGLPGPLHVPEVLAELESRELYGASTLEGYAVCSYRWFVDHELRPQSLEPAPEPLTQGGIMHSVLERLYREPPGDDAMPQPEDLGKWKRRAAELLDGACEERATPDDVIGRVGRRRMLLLIERFLEREAESDIPLRPDPGLIEASFGRGDDDQKGALGLNGLRLHGKIDRVDVAPGGAMGLVRDYKSGKATPAAKLAKEGKLQPQLYMLALRDLWGIEPIGGVYVPLSASKPDKARPRGILDKREKAELLAGGGFVRNDFLDEEDLTEVLDAAHARASEIVADMRAGRITRDPLEDKCPKHCTFQPICRRERAVVVEPVEDEIEEEEL
jgi:ATP-dependent helicase/DNAse subunit B